MIDYLIVIQFAYDIEITFSNGIIAFTLGTFRFYYYNIDPAIIWFAWQFILFVIDWNFWLILKKENKIQENPKWQNKLG